MQDELDQLLVPLLANEFDERLRLELLTELIRGQAVLGKAEVKVLGDWRAVAIDSR